MRKQQNLNQAGSISLPECIQKLPPFWQGLYETLPRQVSYQNLISLGFFKNNKSASTCMKPDPNAPHAYKIGSRAFFDNVEVTLWLFNRDRKSRGYSN